MKYRSINVELHSQYDFEAIPEIEPLPQDPYTSCGVIRTLPKVDEASSTCSVYVPILPGSIFWIEYFVSPPIPDDHYFLFKLYINNAHVVSWSTGKEDGWLGKTMFALYERAEDEEGKKKIEKRALSFLPLDSMPTTEDGAQDGFEDKMRLEIKVHRAHGRKRVERQMEEYKNTQHAKQAKETDGINLINAGRASSDHPKRFYKYALIDPVDQPFATFRYYYRTWDQLYSMGLLEGNWRGTGEDNDMPVIEPYDDAGQDCAPKDASAAFHEYVDGAADTESGVFRSSTSTAKDDGVEMPRSPTKKFVETKKPSTTYNAAQGRTSDAEQPQAYVPRGAPSAKKRASCEQIEQATWQTEENTRTSRTYRLSMPPSIKLTPPEATWRPLPIVPHKFEKSESCSSLAYRPHPAYPMDEWRERTPSPVKSIREGLSTPPLEKHKDQGGRTASLVNAITATWKRRGASSLESRRKTSGSSGERSVSR